MDLVPMLILGVASRSFSKEERDNVLILRFTQLLWIRIPYLCRQAVSLLAVAGFVWDCHLNIIGFQKVPDLLMKFPGHGLMTQSKGKFSFACFTSGQENEYFSRDSTSAVMGTVVSISMGSAR